MAIAPALTVEDSVPEFLRRAFINADDPWDF